ncbi:hypothetical protein JCM33374_g5104 [Metschnikowia sp. JCM 33374]|nr:hypothetical protein JCM33374_g5104 [Metschnikowia sp. JCM 33374]
MVKAALVVVDLQEDFLPPHGSLAVEDGRTVVPGIVDLLDLERFPWKFVAATQDWHPKNHISFASQHGVEPFAKVELSHPLNEKDTSGNVQIRKFTAWPDHCIQDTPGANLAGVFDEAFHELQDKVLTATPKKGYLQDREYYSCLSDCWKTHHTELEGLLREAGVTHVVLVGIAYDFCVLNSALDFVQCGFSTSVISGLSRPVYPEKKAETDQLYTEGGVKIISSAKDLPRDLFL